MFSSNALRSCLEFLSEVVAKTILATKCTSKGTLPGIYSRAFLEGRLTEKHLENFRRELADGGASSYPHPRLMPKFWEFPTVSMGLGPIMAIYQARFNKYLQDRGIKDTSRQRVWCFIGDGDDELETLVRFRSHPVKVLITSFL